MPRCGADGFDVNVDGLNDAAADRMIAIMGDALDALEGEVDEARDFR